MQLVRAAQLGGPHELDALLGAIRPSLLAFFAQRLPPAAAEDLAQVALIRLTRALPRVDPTHADRYLATIVRNLLRTAQRRHAREVRRSSPAELAYGLMAPVAADSQVEYGNLARAVRRASAVLPLPLQEVITGVLHGESYMEIAARQRISPITVCTRLLRARTILRDLLGPYINH